MEEPPVQPEPQLADEESPVDGREADGSEGDHEAIDGEPRESYSPAETHPEPDRVRIGGQRSYSIDRDSARQQFKWQELELSTRCHSGALIEGRWAGIPLEDALFAADPSPETTHVALIGIDGYSRCVSLFDVLDGIVGFECVDGRDDGAPRVVASGLDSQASVMRLRAIEPLSLPPGADPGEAEIDLPADVDG